LKGFNYSISNRVVAEGRTQNALNVIQERVYYAIRKAGYVKSPDDKTVEIYNNNVLHNQPTVVFKKVADDLVMLEGNGVSAPVLKANLSKDCESINWDFSVVNNKVVFDCSITNKEGQVCSTLPNVYFVAYYRSNRPTVPAVIVAK